MSLDDDNDIARLFSQFGGDPGTYQEISTAAPAVKASAMASMASSVSAPSTAAAAFAPGPRFESAVNPGLARAFEGMATPTSIPMPSPSVQVDPFHRLAAGLGTEIGSQSLPDVFKRLLAL